MIDSPKSKPRNDETQPLSLIKKEKGDEVASKPRQRTFPSLCRQPTFLGRMMQAGLDAPNATSDTGFYPNKTL